VEFLSIFREFDRQGTVSFCCGIVLLHFIEIKIVVHPF
jgi:hypothetical protein